MYDTLPKDLFKEHDVGVDLIVTPTQVIRVSPKPPRTAGINWSLLSNRRLKIFPILRQLREKDVRYCDSSALELYYFLFLVLQSMVFQYTKCITLLN